MRNFTSIAKFAKSVMLAAFVAVGVQVANAQETTTYEPVDANQWWMGEAVADVEGEAYLYNVGAQIFATDNTPKETNIDNADLWTIASGYKFTNKKTGNVFHMERTYSVWEVKYNWTATIQSKDATSFNLENGTSTNKGKAYRLALTLGTLAKQTRYLSISDNKYTAEESKSANNDWLFISATQKEAYNEYKTLFNNLKEYLSNEIVAANEEKVAKIQDVLTAVSDNNNSYNTYKVENGDKKKLTDEIEAIKKFIETATGIKNIDGATSTEATAIYDLNGVRKNQLTKGINIVKMAKGKVKKVLVK